MTYKKIKEIKSVKDLKDGEYYCIKEGYQGEKLVFCKNGRIYDFYSKKRNYIADNTYIYHVALMG